MDATRLMRRAIALAGEASPGSGDQPFGAVIARQGVIVGEGRNRVGTTCDPSAHSEIVAIRDACRRLGATNLVGCDIYASCEPCAMCVAALWWAGVDRVFFGCSLEEAAALGYGDLDLLKEVSLPIAERRIAGQRLLENEARDALAKAAQTIR